MKLVRTCGICVVCILAELVASTAFASEGENFKDGVNYIAIKPPLVVNYGGPGRVKYIKAELSLRTENAHNAAEIAHHMPLIRDTLIMLISSVTDEQMASGEGKEKMRVDALKKINEALDHAENPNAVAQPAKAATKEVQAKADKPKKDEHEKDDKDANQGPVVSDLLFDNLVVQK